MDEVFQYHCDSLIVLLSSRDVIITCTHCSSSMETLQRKYQFCEQSTTASVTIRTTNCVDMYMQYVKSSTYYIFHPIQTANSPIMLMGTTNAVTPRSARARLTMNTLPLLFIVCNNTSDHRIIF